MQVKTNEFHLEYHRVDRHTEKVAISFLRQAKSSGPLIIKIYLIHQNVKQRFHKKYMIHMGAVCLVCAGGSPPHEVPFDSRVVVLLSKNVQKEDK